MNSEPIRLRGRSSQSPAPLLVLLADIDTGADLIPSFTGNGWEIAPVVPLGNYLEAGLNFLGTTPTTDSSDQTGYGGHGSIMAAYYAQMMLTMFGIAPHVVPLVAGDAQTLYTDAIGRAQLWVAAEQQRMNAQGRAVQWIVTVEASPGFAGPTELAGRRALDALGIPIIQPAGNSAQDISRLGFEFDQSPTSLIMAAVRPDRSALEPYSNYGSICSYATVPDAFGTSGAAMVAAAYVTGERLTSPSLSTWQLIWQVKHQGLLRGI
jgi:hypothetical protein